MTRERDFKKLVRARMARTGERYAAARAHLARDQAGVAAGAHPETSALVRLLAHAGVTGPSGATATEALALGLGGGIGAACFTFEYKGHAPTFYVATRCEPQYAYGPEFLRTAAERFGATCTIAEASTPAAGAKRLAEHVARGPVIAWVDLAALPWSRTLGGAADLGAMPHVIVVESIDDDTAIVRDTPTRPFAIALADLAAARKRLRVGKHRVLAISKGSPPDWPAVVRDAIASCAAGLSGRTKIKGAMAKNFGLGGLRRWQAALADPEQPKAWARVFGPPHAASALAWTRHWIEHAGTGSGAFRPLYAEFLEVAARVTKQPALASLARDYRALGAEWSAFATALLPDRIGAFAAIRSAQDARHAAFQDGDLDAISATEKRVAAATRQATLDAGKLRAHYAELAEQLAMIVEREAACADRLAAAE